MRTHPTSSTPLVSIALFAVAIVAVTIMTASNVSAEPPADPKDAAKTNAKSKAPNSATLTPLKLKISESTAARSLDFSPLTVAQPTAEKRRGFSLGDDSSWKTHVIQAGAMTALFGALVGLCGGGACTIPKAVTDPLPSWLKAKPHQVIDPRPPQPIRNL